MPTVKQRVIALESRLGKIATIEDIVKAIDDEKRGIEVLEQEWQHIRVSPPYKLMESIVIKEQLNRGSRELFSRK